MTPLSHLETHALNLGKLTGNLLTLEMLARMVIAQRDAQWRGERAENLLGIPESDWVGIGPFTNRDDLRQTLEKYNRHAAAEWRLDVDPIVRLRDALAHGRMFGSGPLRPDASLRLMKFGKKLKAGRVQVELALAMTPGWFSENIAMLSAALRKATNALDYEMRELAKR
jgi:hypothetical protein